MKILFLVTILTISFTANAAPYLYENIYYGKEFNPLRSYQSNLVNIENLNIRKELEQKFYFVRCDNEPEVISKCGRYSERLLRIREKLPKNIFTNDLAIVFSEYKHFENIMNNNYAFGPDSYNRFLLEQPVVLDLGYEATDQEWLDLILKYSTDYDSLAVKQKYNTTFGVPAKCLLKDYFQCLKVVKKLMENDFSNSSITYNKTALDIYVSDKSSFTPGYYDISSFEPNKLVLGEVSSSEDLFELIEQTYNLEWKDKSGTKDAMRFAKSFFGEEWHEKTLEELREGLCKSGGVEEFKTIVGERKARLAKVQKALKHPDLSLGERNAIKLIIPAVQKETLPFIDMVNYLTEKCRNY